MLAGRWHPALRGVFSQVRAGCPGSRALGGAESQGQAGHGNRTAPAEFELAADNMTEMGDWEWRRLNVKDVGYL